MTDCLGMEMNPEVWEDLSHDVVLLTLILMRLPWWSNLQLRRVCKAWDSMLRNHTLLSKFSPIQPPTESFVCILKNRLQHKIVHSSVRKWHTLPQSKILPKLITPSNQYSRADVIAASSGLLLVSGNFLVNPLNGTERRLCPLPTRDYDDKGFRIHGAVTLRMTTDDHNVKVVLLEHLYFLDLWRICVFDLLKNSWDVVSDSLQIERHQYIKNIVVVGNDLFLLIKSRDSDEHRVFYVSANCRTEIPVEQTSIDVPTVHLFKHQGSLGIVKVTNANLPVVEIWGLDQLNKTWEKITSMPSNLLDVCYRNNARPFFTIDTEGDYICISSCGRRLKCIIVYNIVKQVWSHISYEDTEEDGIRQCVINRTVHIWQPRLDIVL